MFGLGQDRQTGVTTTEGAVPGLEGADNAAAAIVRGEICFSAVGFAPLTATIQSGSFRHTSFGDPKNSGKDIDAHPPCSAQP
ncbi:hypothetical protein GCM10009566_42830 [Streptomyces murinus]